MQWTKLPLWTDMWGGGSSVGRANWHTQLWEGQNQPGLWGMSAA